jgi:lipopolysaccharide assembly outer membrane protein LptD (OstA)
VKVSYDAHGDDFSAANPSGPEGDHKFEEGEPLANQGQRLVAHPRLSYPIALGDVLEVVPEAGYYGTFYQAQYGGTAVRNLFTGRLDLHARLRGAMHLPFGIGATTHEVEPYVAWIGLSGAGQNGNPLFLPPTAVPQERLRLLELDNVLLDPSDRLHATEEVVVGVTNRWLRPSDGSLLADLILTSGYDFAGNAWAPAVLQGQVHLPLGLFGRFHAVADLSRTVFSDGLVDFGWSSRQGHSLGIRYRYVRDIPQVFENFLRNDRFQAYQNSFSRINQISGNSRVQVTENWALTYAGSFSFENTVSLINQFGVEYLSQCKCWAVRLEIDEDRVRGFSWRLRYRLVGLGDQKQRLFKH